MGHRMRYDAPVMGAGPLVFDSQIVEVDVVVVCEFDSIVAVVALVEGLVL